MSRLRHALRVRGVVQGVGFRPAVFRLATEHGLVGLVRNDAEGVWIEIEGPAPHVQHFPQALREGAPPLSRIGSIEVTPLEPRGDSAFKVVESRTQSGVRAVIPADSATCDSCLRELFDASDRRHRYPFINCTDCGPRFTIVRDVPYDRARTTMAAFEMCGPCRAEYEDPRSRRFHAEPNACPVCGPQLWACAKGEELARGNAAVVLAVETVRAGRIVAVKGLGGFFLAVDPRNEHAVEELRARKRRPHKPFALMARDLNVASELVELDEAARDLLRSPVRPIVLAPARGGQGIAHAVSPALRERGVMLPYTPLHHLLAEQLDVVVMTSGNVSEEPIARENDEALRSLAEIADLFVLNDRDIHTRADDSVMRAMSSRPQPVRRGRGLVPESVALPFDAPPVLAVGAELKNTVALARLGEVFVSQHIGDLSTAESFAFFEEVIAKLQALIGVEPTCVAHDLHPDYASTRWALRRGLPRIAVQHHHAHVASCLAEHGKTSPAIGVVFDGTGCGPAGDLWGGEILIADLLRFERFAHLRPIALAGGEAAIREPWRLACAALLDAGLQPERVLDVAPERIEAISALLRTGTSAPLATGAGRWFDAVSVLCDGPQRISYEGQAAIELEQLAEPGEAEPFPFGVVEGALPVFDLRLAIRELVQQRERGVAPPRLAARFHETLARIVVRACTRAREARKLSTVALSGGCFQNRLLSDRCCRLLEGCGFEVLIHRRVPPNDGGIALGQAAVASFILSRREDGHVSGNSR
jgi:hydrogenase maturation protein HypF